MMIFKKRKVKNNKNKVIEVKKDLHNEKIEEITKNLKRMK